MRVGDLVQYRGWEMGTSPVMLVVKVEEYSLNEGNGKHVTIHSKLSGDVAAKIHTVHSDWIEVISENR